MLILKLKTARHFAAMVYLATTQPINVYQSVLTPVLVTLRSVFAWISVLLDYTLTTIQ